MSMFKQCRKRVKGIFITLIFVVGQAFGSGPALGLTTTADITADYLYFDSFTSGSLAGYTELADRPALWSANSSEGSLTAAGGQQSKLVVNGLTVQDVELEAQLSSSVDGGLVARFQDNYNYYLLAVRDGTHYPANLELYKRVQGNYTSLGIASVSWPLGTSPSVKFIAQGSKLEASFNGQVVLSVEDNSISAAGSVGLRQCTAFGASPDAVVYNELKVRDLALPVPIIEVPDLAPATETNLSADVLKPISADGSSVFQKGRVIPVKFRLNTAAAALGSDGVPKLFIAPVTGDPAGLPPSPVEVTSPENMIKYDAAEGVYHFNLSTQDMALGDWLLIIEVNGRTMEIGFKLR